MRLNLKGSRFEYFIYAFEFDPVRLGRLVEGLDQVFELVYREMEIFADFLEELTRDEENEPL